MKQIHLILISILIACSAQAQSYGITDMYIIPTQPTEADEVSLVIHAYLPHSPCNLIDQTLTIEIIDNEIMVEAEYYSGFLTATCTTVDTVLIGQLSAGYYDLTFLFESEFSSDADSLSFVVETPTSIRSNQQSEMELNVFPNPLASGNLNVSYTLETISEVNLEVYDLSGKLVVQKNEGYQSPGGYTIEMDLKDLPKGVYLFKMTTEKEVLSRRVVVQ